MHLDETRRGYLLALSAYVMWGLFPLYLHILADLRLPSLEVMANRVIWGAVFSMSTLLIWKSKGWLTELIAHPLRLATLALSGALVGSTQLIYIWAMNHGMLIEASLGYYILPLLNVLLGFSLLKERLTTIQWLCVSLATIGVLQQLIQLGTLPWVSFLLAFTFSLYGLIRKRAPIAPLPGLCVENIMLTPFAITWLALNPESASISESLWSSLDVLWIIGIGPVTLIPLLCFNGATRRLPYSTIGFLQYISPTLILLLAVFFFGEQMKHATLTTFGFIWAGLILYIYDLWKNIKTNTKIAATPGSIEPNTAPQTNPNSRSYKPPS